MQNTRQPWVVDATPVRERRPGLRERQSDDGKSVVVPPYGQLKRKALQDVTNAPKKKKAKGSRTNVSVPPFIKQHIAQSVRDKKAAREDYIKLGYPKQRISDWVRVVENGGSFRGAGAQYDFDVNACDELREDLDDKFHGEAEGNEDILEEPKVGFNDEEWRDLCNKKKRETYERRTGLHECVCVVRVCCALFVCVCATHMDLEKMCSRTYLCSLCQGKSGYLLDPMSLASSQEWGRRIGKRDQMELGMQPMHTHTTRTPSVSHTLSTAHPDASMQECVVVGVNSRIENLTDAERACMSQTCALLNGLRDPLQPERNIKPRNIYNIDKVGIKIFAPGKGQKWRVMPKNWKEAPVTKKVRGKGELDFMTKHDMSCLPTVLSCHYSARSKTRTCPKVPRSS